MERSLPSTLPHRIRHSASSVSVSSVSTVDDEITYEPRERVAQLLFWPSEMAHMENGRPKGYPTFDSLLPTRSDDRPDHVCRYTAEPNELRAMHALLELATTWRTTRHTVADE